MMNNYLEAIFVSNFEEVYYCGFSWNNSTLLYYDQIVNQFLYKDDFNKDQLKM